MRIVRGTGCALLAVAVTWGQASGAENRGDGAQEPPLCEAAGTTLPISLADALVQALQNEPHVVIARQDLAETKAEAKAALAPFFPKGQFIVDEGRLIPSNPFQPVTVIG